MIRCHADILCHCQLFAMKITYVMEGVIEISILDNIFISGVSIICMDVLTQSIIG